MTREEWLHKAIEALAAGIFADALITLPEGLQVSVGFPATGGRSGKRIGECWKAETKDGTRVGVNNIFIHPKLEQPELVLATLVHELVHAADNCDNGHKKAFKRMALAVGLTGRMSATVAGPELLVKFKELLSELPDYPHRPLNIAGPKKQTTRNLKLSCEDCGYTCRTTQKWLDTYDEFPCPCGAQMRGGQEE